MKIRIPIFILTILIATSGCTIISNLDELMTLGEYSREKQTQHKLRAEINARYDALVVSIEANPTCLYQNSEEFTKNFGEPISKSKEEDGHQVWLYRYMTFRESKTKVYVHFDKDGRFVKWEKIECFKLY